jgi:hypothetical protein
MTVDISRELIVERLGRVTYDRFLFYVMGPYKSFNLNYVLSEKERREIDIDDLPGPLRRLFRNKDDIDAAQVLLRRIQGKLRTDPGVNAFLALDVDIDTDDVDAVTQSIEYARCSNATAFVLPFLGHNFGVGEEAGSILESLSDTHGERLIPRSHPSGKRESNRDSSNDTRLPSLPKRHSGISSTGARSSSWVRGMDTGRTKSTV